METIEDYYKGEAQAIVDRYRLILQHSGTDAGEEILCTIIAKECAMQEVTNIMLLLRLELPQDETVKKLLPQYQWILQQIRKI